MKKILFVAILLFSLFFSFLFVDGKTEAWANRTCGLAPDLNTYFEFNWQGKHWKTFIFGVAGGGDTTNEECTTTVNINSDNDIYSFLKWENTKAVRARIGVPSDATPTAPFSWFGGQAGKWGTDKCGEEPASNAIHNRPPVYYFNRCQQAAMVDDAGRIELKDATTGAFKTIVCEGMDECGRVPEQVPAVGNAGNMFVEDNCPNGQRDWALGKPIVVHDCADATFSWYKPYIGGTELTSIIGTDSGKLKNVEARFNVRSTVRGGFGSRVVVSLGYDMCSDGTVPPDGDLTKCFGGPPSSCPMPLVPGYESTNPIPNVLPFQGTSISVKYTPKAYKPIPNFDHSDPAHYWPISFNFNSEVTPDPDPPLSCGSAVSSVHVDRIVKNDTSGIKYVDTYEDPAIGHRTYNDFTGIRLFQADDKICGTISIPQSVTALEVRPVYSITGSRTETIDNPPPGPSSSDGSITYYRFEITSYEYRYVRQAPPETSTECYTQDKRRPYMKVFGGEIWAGGKMCDTGNTEVTTSEINGNADLDAPGNHRGASVQYAIYAVGLINGLYSDSQNPSALADKLSFANSEPGDYGGGYGQVPFASTRKCVKSHWQGGPPDEEKVAGFPEEDKTVKVIDSTVTSISAKVLRDYMCQNKHKRIYSDHTLTITAPVGGSACGAHIILSVKGDAIINANNLNSIIIGVFGGSVRISPGVSRLVNVTLTAMPSGLNNVNSGSIFTCHDGESPAPTPSECESQLVIVGSLSAQRFIFGRTLGNAAQPVAPSASCAKPTEFINYAGPGTAIGTLPGNTTNINGKTVIQCTNAAEVFINSWQVDETDLFEEQRIDSITSLPPVF